MTTIILEQASHYIYQVIMYLAALLLFIGLIILARKKLLSEKEDDTMDKSVDPQNQEKEASSPVEHQCVTDYKQPNMILSQKNSDNIEGEDSSIITSITNQDVRQIRPTESVEYLISSIPEFPVVEEIEIEETPKELSKPKYIGYNPVNIFAQTEPLHYPYVVMPKKPNCVIKFPRKGRNGRKGYKEDAFLHYLQLNFINNQVYNDRFVLTKNNTNRYEPDFTIIDENSGINIFMDIEIDEPYEGLNDINQRRATHYQHYDTNRNNEFISRGWIVIRFAEIQIHQNPAGCCRFIADVIRSINPNFNYPENLLAANIIAPIQQWTEKEAKQWSIQKYREKYLGINCFGITDNIIASLDYIPTEEEIAIETEVVDEKKILPSEITATVLSDSDIIDLAININKYITFKYNGNKTIIKPIKHINSILTGYCYIKNKELNFNIEIVTDIHLKENYYTERFISPELGLKKVADIMNIVISNQKFVRMKYTRGEWTNIYVDPTTGKSISDRTEAEESIRTISNIELDDYWGEHYIKAYCHRREEGRTFRFDRISELELLDL